MLASPAHLVGVHPVIKVGVSAWTEKTLVASGWYPRGARNAEARLRYYASRFPLAEVDSTYYALPTRHQAEVWVARTPPSFTFNVKAYAPFTEHYTDARRLPRDVLTQLPLLLQSKEKLYPKELPVGFAGELARRFADALEPLRQSGKLGAVLFQYPVWFTFSRDNLDKLARLARVLPGFPLAVEFRNRTWLSEHHRDHTLAALREHRLAYTCVDEPQGFASSVPPVAAATSTLAMLRMHGRNVRTWEAPVESAAARMAYLYRVDELREWLPGLRHLASRADEIHVVMNNCHRDFAVRNAVDMAWLLAQEGIGDVRPRVGGPPPWERPGQGASLHA